MTGDPKTMKIRVLYFDGCPSYEPAVATVREVVAEQNLDVEIELIRVSSKEEAIAQRFFGSPTVQINGVDIEELNALSKEAGLCCRMYDLAGSLRGQPSKEMIRTALSSNRNET